MHDLLDAGGSVQRLDSKPGHFPLHRGDVLAYSFQGGGGYGDPIRRDPERVAARRAPTASSRRTGRPRFTAWCCATARSTPKRPRARRRREIRTRAPRRPRAEGRAAPATGLAAVCPRSIRRKRFRCLCGADLGPATESWKPRAHRRVVPPQASAPHLTLHAELELREFACSECGTLLEVEVARRGQESLATIVLTPDCRAVG